MVGVRGQAIANVASIIKHSVDSLDYPSSSFLQALASAQHLRLQLQSLPSTDNGGQSPHCHASHEAESVKTSAEDSMQGMVARVSGTDGQINTSGSVFTAEIECPPDDSLVKIHKLIDPRVFFNVQKSKRTFIESTMKNKCWSPVTASLFLIDPKKNGDIENFGTQIFEWWNQISGTDSNNPLTGRPSCVSPHSLPWLQEHRPQSLHSAFGINCATLSTTRKRVGWGLFTTHSNPYWRPGSHRNGSIRPTGES